MHTFSTQAAIEMIPQYQFPLEVAFVEKNHFQFDQEYFTPHYFADILIYSHHDYF